jgi:hypothetical protein
MSHSGAPYTPRTQIARQYVTIHVPPPRSLAAREITAPPARSLLCSANSPVPLLFFGGGDETLENGSRYNPSVISFIRDEWLYRQAKLRCVCAFACARGCAALLRRAHPRAAQPTRARARARAACGFTPDPTPSRPARHIHSESEYTEYKALRLFVGTWNVNGKSPRESLAPWLTDGVSDGDMPDIYVLGCVDAWRGRACRCAAATAAAAYALRPPPPPITAPACKRWST